MDRIPKPGAKKESTDFQPHKCPDSGGAYQELPTLGAFSEVTGGSRLQRITNNCYSKEHLKKNEKPSLMDTLLNVDNGGPPFDNVSRPHRIF
jgi:hypothetical protein